jgi:hypothetical protein
VARPTLTNIKELRNRQIDGARHAEHAYEQFVSRWQTVQ